MDSQSQAQPDHDETTPARRLGRTWQAGAPLLYIVLLALCELGAIKLLIYILREWEDTRWLREGIEYAWYFSVVSLVGLSFVLVTLVRWPLRVLSGIIGLALLVAIVRLMWKHEEQLVILAVSQLAFLITLLAIGRGLRIYAVRADPKVRASKVGSKRMQLSIADMLLWTAGFAGLFWVTQSLRIDFSDIANDYREIVGFGSVFCAVAICALWVALTDTRWPLLTAVVALTVPCLAELCQVFLDGPPPQRPFWYSFVVAQLLFVGAAMLVLRVHGYRLVRSNTPGTTGTADSPLSSSQWH